ncbi:hypothetical protein UT300012_23270 [Paraclostridium bifermentans]
MLPKDLKIVVFDTETTGLKDRDQVIQFSCVCLNNEFKVIDMHSFYCNVGIPIPQDAIEVHGISNKKLEELSEGKFIEDYIPHIPYLANATNTLFVGYNVAFDIKKTNYSLESEGYNPVDFGTKVETFPKRLTGRNFHMDLMGTLSRNFGYAKNQKLISMFKEHGPCSEKDIEKLLNKLSDKFGVMRNDEQTYHDALFDTMITTSLLIRYKHFYIV